MKERAPKFTHSFLLTAGTCCCHLMGGFFQNGHPGDSWLGKPKRRPGDQETGGHQHNSHIELPWTLHFPHPHTPFLPCEEARLDMGPVYTGASL